MRRSSRLMVNLELQDKLNFGLALVRILVALNYEFKLVAKMH